MNNNIIDSRDKTNNETTQNYHTMLPELVDLITSKYESDTCCVHINYAPIPSQKAIVKIINLLKEVIFPGYFSKNRIDPVNLKFMTGQSVYNIFNMLSLQIEHSLRHEQSRQGRESDNYENIGKKYAFSLIQAIPSIRQILKKDVQATFEGDPAAKSDDEIVFSYPGIFAVTVYRTAHKLHTLGVPLIPRIMTEYAHSVTGIDIHPGAVIGEGFVMDHGTGIVIGETTTIGNNVRVYQNVTLGALSLPKDAGNKYRGVKRHPTIEDDVIIYSGATILGGEAVIGARSVIGGNVWLTGPVPPDTKVIMEKPELIYK